MIYRCEHCKKFLMNFKKENRLKIFKCKSVEFVDKNIIKIKCTCGKENIIKKLIADF